MLASIKASHTIKPQVTDGSGVNMEIVLNGSEVLVLENQRTSRGYRMISCSMNTLNPSEGLTVFIENPQIGAHPWVSYVQLKEDGEPDLASPPVTRMPLSKSRITRVKGLGPS